MAKYKFWVVLGEEETPLGISYAKTEGGAKRIYEENTGRTRDGIHVSVIRFNKKGYYPFVNPL